MPVIDLVTSDSDFPQKITVAIIGGGIIGVATALELAERGISVVLLEKLGLVPADGAGPTGNSPRSGIAETVAGDE